MPLTESLKVVNPTGPTGLLHFWHLKLFGWGGWATPSKSMTSSVGIMTFPTELNNKTCSKPPTSIIIYYRCIYIYIYTYICSHTIPQLNSIISFISSAYQCILQHTNYPVIICESHRGSSSFQTRETETVHILTHCTTEVWWQSRHNDGLCRRFCGMSEISWSQYPVWNQ